jgi:hypothetical protein
LGLDGREMIAELRAGCLEFDASPAVQISVCDVSDRARARQSLREQSRALAALVSHFPGNGLSLAQCRCPRPGVCERGLS